MDGNNWRSNSGQVQIPGQVMGGEAPAAPGMDAGDWRTQLPSDFRPRVVNKIMDTLKRHLPFSGQEGLQELKKIAVKFEERTYTDATCQKDYLRKIYLKMLTMETKSQNPMANSLQSNAPSNSKNPQDPGSVLQSQSTPNGNSKSLRLFGVNVECHADECGRPPTPDGSPMSSQGQAHHQYYSNYSLH